MKNNIIAYVSEVTEELIKIEVLDSCIIKFLKNEGFSYNSEFKEWHKKILNDEKSTILERLRDKEICFADGPAGWPPGAIFSYLREQGKVSGTYCAISWVNHGEFIIHEK